MVAAQESRKVLRLDHPLVALSIAYDGKEKVSLRQHEKEVEASYKSGYDEASSHYNQQILEFRSEVNAMREGTFSQLESKFLTIVGEAREALMTLTYECVRRALGGFEMQGEAISAIVEAVVKEADLDDERMEVKLHPLDLALLNELAGDLQARHPGLQLLGDATLRRGDCVLHSRFGKIDATMATKMEKLKGSLRPS